MTVECFWINNIWSQGWRCWKFNKVLLADSDHIIESFQYLLMFTALECKMFQMWCPLSSKQDYQPLAWVTQCVVYNTLPTLVRWILVSAVCLQILCSYYLATEGGTYYISQLYALHSGTHWRVVLITQWYKIVQITQWYKVVHFTQCYTLDSGTHFPVFPCVIQYVPLLAIPGDKTWRTWKHVPN